MSVTLVYTIRRIKNTQRNTLLREKKNILNVMFAGKNNIDVVLVSTDVGRIPERNLINAPYDKKTYIDDNYQNY
jgi:hypothetical protein